MLPMTKDNVEFLQSACNPLAVARTLYEWSQQIMDEQRDMNAIKENPYLLAVIGKLCDLYRIEHDGERAYKYLTELK